jgi:Tol biopolymer transport system component
MEIIKMPMSRNTLCHPVSLRGGAVIKTLALLAALVIGSAAQAAGPVVAMERVSIGSDGHQSIGESFSSAISADGRYVAFDSADGYLGSPATHSNSVHLSAPTIGVPVVVYVRDRSLGTTELINVKPNGEVGNGWATGPAISADGRYVAFTSFAPDLVAGDTNGVADVFVRDRTLGTTVRASVVGDGPDIGGGGYGGASYLMPNWFSANGRYVLFSTYARLTSNDTNGTFHLYRRDLVAGVTELVSVNPLGIGVNNVNAGGSISADGRYVMFQSGSNDIVAGIPAFAQINNLFVRDMLLGVTTSLTPNLSTPDLCWFGSGDNQSYNLSRNGRFAVFNSYCDDIAPGQDMQDTLFVRDLLLGTTSILRLTESGVLDPAGGSFLSISNSGRDVVAWAYLDNFGGTNIDNFSGAYLRDRVGLQTFRISQRVDGAPANSYSYSPSVSGAGHIVFASDASNLVNGDTNGYRDIFVVTLDAVFAGGFE